MKNLVILFAFFCAFEPIEPIANSFAVLLVFNGADLLVFAMMQVVLQ